MRVRGAGSRAKKAFGWGNCRKEELFSEAVSSFREDLNPAGAGGSSSSPVLFPFDPVFLLRSFDLLVNL
jgi:hypothetical protein